MVRSRQISTSSKCISGFFTPTFWNWWLKRTLDLEYFDVRLMRIRAIRLIYQYWNNTLTCNVSNSIWNLTFLFHVIFISRSKKQDNSRVLIIWRAALSVKTSIKPRYIATRWWGEGAWTMKRRFHPVRVGRVHFSNKAITKKHFDVSPCTLKELIFAGTNFRFIRGISAKPRKFEPAKIFPS